MKNIASHCHAAGCVTLEWLRYAQVVDVFLTFRLSGLDWNEAIVNDEPLFIHPWSMVSQLRLVTH